MATPRYLGDTLSSQDASSVPAPRSEPELPLGVPVNDREPTGSPTPSAIYERTDTGALTPVPAMAGARIQRIALIVLVVVSFLAAAWVTSTLWSGILFGVLTAFTVEPWNRYLLRRFPKRRALAAGVSISVVGLLCAGLLVGLSALVTSELLDAVRAVQALARDFSPAHVLGPRAERSLEAVGITPALIAERLSHVADRVTEIVYGLVSSALGSTLAILGGSLIAFVTAYYTLKDGRPIERRLQEILPLNPRITRELVDDFRKVGRGTLIGSGLAGLIQGAFAAVGYALCGVPRALLLGVLTAVASFVPVFGTMLVWIPVGIGLILAGHAAAGIFQIVWGVVVTTTLVDYVIRPFVVGRESRSHPLLFLIGVIGGVEVFGGVGVIAGPIVMALFASVLRIYRRDVVNGSNAARG